MNGRLIKLMSVLVLIISVPLLSAHTDHNHEDDYVWSWTDNYDRGDTYTWLYSASNPDISFNEIKLEVDVLEDLDQVNIKSELIENPTFIIDPTVLDVRPNSQYSSYFSQFNPFELILPIVFDFQNSTQGTYFELDLLNVIDLPFVHVGLNISNYNNNPNANVTVTESSGEVEFSGEFSSFYYTPEDIIIENGTFTSIYDKSNGLLKSFNWQDNAQTYTESIEIELSDGLNLPFPLYPVTLGILGMVIIYRRFKKKK